MINDVQLHIFILLRNMNIIINKNICITINILYNNIFKNNYHKISIFFRGLYILIYVKFKQNNTLGKLIFF